MEYLRRKIDAYFANWKRDVSRKPLIIKGARQVGKTRSILHFSKTHYKNCVYINFVEEPKYTQIVDDGYSAVEVIKSISRVNPDFKFVPNETLIVFDEIQAFPDIVTTLKFFNLDGRFDVICSGSLLGINYREISSVSVGYKTDLEMKSFDFEEFLWAHGYGDEIKDEILSHMIEGRAFSDGALKLYENLFLDYCIVGGMPEVVENFIESKNFSNIRELQKQIVNGYKDDIRKYAVGVDKARISNVFESVVFQLGKQNKKFQVSKIKSGARFSDYRGCVEWLEEAGIVNVARALQTPELPLKGNVIENNIKIYYADSGLLLSQLDDEAQDDLRQNKNLNVYKGGLFESIIGEALVKSDYVLRFFKKENSTLELDFFVRTQKNLVPVEIKAGNNTAKSLATVIKSDDYPEIKFGVKFVKGNIGCENNIYTFPHFCVFLLKKFLATIKD